LTAEVRDPPRHDRLDPAYGIIDHVAADLEAEAIEGHASALAWQHATPCGEA
jgi:hypothetical protein